MKTPILIRLSESGGMLYYLNDTKQEYVKELEDTYNADVYHVIHDSTELG